MRVENDHPELVACKLGYEGFDRDPWNIFNEEWGEHEHERLGTCFAQKVLRDQILHLAGALARDNTRKATRSTQRLGKTGCARNQDVDAAIHHHLSAGTVVEDVEAGATLETGGHGLSAVGTQV